MSTRLSTYRVQKYREDLRNPGNEEKLKEYKEKQRKYKEMHLKKIKDDPVKAKLKKEKNAERMRKSRANAAEKVDSNMDLTSPTSTPGFRSKAAKSKALNRTEKALPKDPVKKKIVLDEIMKRHKISSEIPAKTPQKRPRKSFVDLPKIIKEFYLCEAVSRLMPGKDDCITIKHPDGSREKVQKYIMIVTISDAFEEFQKTFPAMKCSLSYFTQQRPKKVMKKSDSKHYSCLCTICENFQLLCTAISTFITQKKFHSAREILERLCCDSNNFECSNNECNDCAGYMDEIRSLLMPCCLEEPVKWFKWEKGGENRYIEKILQADKNVGDVLKEFEESFKKFKLHKFVQLTQKNYLNESREKLEENEAIIIVDYAEKYTTTFQRAVQSSYFGSRAISIFTARAYVGRQAEYSFAIVSDNTNQGKHEVFACLKYIIGQLKLRHENLTHVKVFSDGCGGQFKNRFHFKNLLHAVSDFNITLELAFFATGHGKSPCDGIGAAIKRHVRYNVLAERFNVINASDFVNCAQSFADRIKVYELTQAEIDTYHAILSTRWDEKKVKKVAGTMKFHSFKVTGQQGVIQASITSYNHNPENFVLI
jgi:hypothetical protein